MPRILVDIAEFIENPVKTGIQRVVRELLSNWPADIDVEFVRFDSVLNSLCAISPKAIEFAIDIASNPYGSIDQLSAVLREFMASEVLTPVLLKTGDRILVPELFISLRRSKFYQNLSSFGASLYIIVYDIVPWTHPDAMNIVYLGGFNDYMMVVKGADHRCFDSSAVRSEYYDRILRAPLVNEFVASLGADGLGINETSEKREYLVYPGALDGKKQQDRVYRAFRQSRAYERYDLVIAGRVPPSPRDGMREMLESGDPKLRIVDNPSDEALAVLIAQAQACVFTSRFEGFGLPALESLYLGTPVVVDKSLPAVSNFPELGQIRLQTGNEDELIEVLNKISDPLEIRRLEAEIATLDLPTWMEFAQSVATWINS